jgi:hypothetical protein
MFLAKAKAQEEFANRSSQPRGWRRRGSGQASAMLQCYSPCNPMSCEEEPTRIL